VRECLCRHLTVGDRQTSWERSGWNLPTDSLLHRLAMVGDMILDMVGGMARYLRCLDLVADAPTFSQCGGDKTESCTNEDVVVLGANNSATTTD